MLFGEVEDATVRLTIKVTRHESVENIGLICFIKTITIITNENRGIAALTINMQHLAQQSINIYASSALYYGNDEF